MIVLNDNTSLFDSTQHYKIYIISFAFFTINKYNFYVTSDDRIY
jgi:hypothetical protein